jgi:hypothetical protein
MDQINTTPKIFQTFLDNGQLHQNGPKPLDIFGQNAVREIFDLFEKLVLLKNHPAINLDDRPDHFRICEIHMDALHAWKPEMQTVEHLVEHLSLHGTGRYYIGHLSRQDEVVTGLDWVLPDLENSREPAHHAQHLLKRSDGIFYLDALHAKGRFEVHTAFIDHEGKMVGESLVACPETGHWKLPSEVPLPPPSAEFWEQFSFELRRSES